MGSSTNKPEVLMHSIRGWLLIAFGLGLAVTSGCAVPQPRGEGKYSHVKEPTTGARYHLYLPVDYVKNAGRHPNPKMKKWPLVMTFHGMKPYDNARPQEREWERQADVYGYIVCAPELDTSDSFMEYPLTREHDYVLRDKRNVIAIMDHVFNTTAADPNRVLSTSWSCGGYLAHYFPNRFPDRFSCIATRLSNFSSQLLIEETVPKYRQRIPVAIFIGDGDFPACKTESEEAVAWYTARGFRVVRGKMIDDMGHSRIPQTAAAFFAEQIGLEPLSPVEAATAVAEVHMTEYYPPPEMIAKVSPPMGVNYDRTAVASRTDRTRRSTTETTPALPPRTTPAREPSPSYANATAGRRYPFDRPPSYDPTPGNSGSKPQVAAATPATRREPAATKTPERVTAADRKPNWLDAPKTQPPPKPSQANNSRIAKAEPAPRTAAPRPAVSQNAKPAVTAQAKPKEPPARVATAAPATRTPVPATTTTRRRFTPSDAGARRYGPVAADQAPASAANFQRSGSPRPNPAAAPTNSNTQLAAAHDEAAAVQPRSRPNRVNIRLSGPAIGSSPHYLAYSVDLPREAVDGADFLWMDNGVWIGNEPRGVKILESPGLHRISVLIVTKANIEYRGTATVQVLERGPTAAAY